MTERSRRGGDRVASVGCRPSRLCLLAFFLAPRRTPSGTLPRAGSTRSRSAIGVTAGDREPLAFHRMAPPAPARTRWRVWRWEPPKPGAGRELGRVIPQTGVAEGYGSRICFAGPARRSCSAERRYPATVGTASISRWRTGTSATLRLTWEWRTVPTATPPDGGRCRAGARTPGRGAAPRHVGA
jgi:hypothetical protein